MTMDVGTLSVKLSVLDQDAIKSLDNFQDKMNKIGTDMIKVGGIMTASITAPIALMGKAMFTAASDFEESLNKVNVAFGDSSQEVKNFAKTALENFGIAEGSALDMAALFGDMGTAMGLTTKDAAGMSKGLVGLAGDLASFKNIQIDVAQTALAGIFTGETESLKRLGIVMTEANLEQFALSKGYQTLYKDLTQAEKVQLRYEYVTEMSKNAVGDFARTSDGAANQTRTMNESLKEASAEFGQQLLPIIVPVIEKITELVKWFGLLDEDTKKVIITSGLFIAAIGPVVTLIGALTTAVGMLGAAFTFLMSPIGLIVIAIAAVIAIGVLLLKNWDTITEYAGKIWEGVKAGFVKMWDAITDVFTNMVSGLSWFIDEYIMKPFDIDLFQAGKEIIQSLWNGIVDTFNSLKSKFEEIGKMIADYMSGNASPYPTTLPTYNLNVGATTTQAKAPTNLGVAGGVKQTVVINSPTTLSPKVVAKETTKLAQALAKGLYE